MRKDISRVLGGMEVPDEADLIGLGLDSVRVMLLAAKWQKRGSTVCFADLIQATTLAGWWEIVQHAPVASGHASADSEAGNDPIDETAPFDLAVMQHAYWVGRQDGQPLGGVGAHFYNEFDGADVDPERLDRALRALVARHGMLRARFLPDGRQQILPDSPWPGVTVHDLRDLANDEVDAALRSLRDTMSHRRLDVAEGEVFDVHLSLLPGCASRVHVHIEMLVADALSFRILLADLARLYEDPAVELAPIDYSYPRYLADKAQRQATARERAKAYWEERVPDLPGGPQLPLHTDPARLDHARTARRYHWLSQDDWALLARRAGLKGVTLSMVFVTAFAEVVGAWSAEQRFVLNLPLYDREPLDPGVADLVGDFTNLVLLEVDATTPAPFAERCRALQGQLQADVAHRAFTGVDVLRAMARAHAGEPLGAPVVFTSALSLGELFDEHVRQCFGVPGWTTSQTPQVWLDCQVTEREQGLFVNWDAVEELFPEGMLDAMF
ncbi:MAG: non-ribosomal peptide synthetase, partial [Actinobacteria bacterium]|nr:non-ribosomal peptide synthetase [Actinomycetota bacterium]